MGKWLLALLLLLPSLPAWAESCTCATGSETFTTAGLGTWAGCTASLRDSFQINSGCTKTVDGTLTLDGSGGADDPNGTIHCNTGTLNFDASSGGFIVTAGGDTDGDPIGIHLDSGCTTTWTPGYRTFGVTPDAIRSDANDPNLIWPMGTIVPCPGWADAGRAGAVAEDCEGDADGVADANTPGDTCQALIFYDNERNFGKAGDAAESIAGIEAAIDATGRPLYVQIVNNGTPESFSAENGQFFEIVDAEGHDTADQDSWILINTCQTLESSPVTDGFYTEAERAWVEWVGEAGAHPAGEWDTLFALPNGIVSVNGEHSGFWAYFEGGREFGIRQGPLLIGRTEHSATAADSMELADDRGGLYFDYAANDNVWIAPVGLAPGHTFMVVEAIEFRNASATRTFGRLVVGEHNETHNDVTIQGVVIRDFDRVEKRGSGNLTMRHVALTDNGAGTGNGTAFTVSDTSAVGTGTVDLRWVNITGTEADGGGEPGTHGFSFGDGVDDTYVARLRDTAFRYLGDDAYVLAAVTTGTNLSCSYIGTSAQSGGCIDAVASVTINGVLALAAKNNTQLPFLCTGTARCIISNVVDVGGLGSPGLSCNAGICNLTNYTSLGSSLAFLQGPGQMEHFVVRDIRHTGPILTVSASAQSHNHGIIRDTSTTGTNWSQVGGAVDGIWNAENVLILNANANTDTAPPNANARVFNVGGSSLSGTLRRVTWAWTETFNQSDPNRWQRGLNIAAGDYSGLSIDGIMLTGYQPDTGSFGFWQAADADVAEMTLGPGNFCFWNNVAGGSGANMDISATTTFGTLTPLRFENPGFLDEARGDFSPQRDGLAAAQGCGILGGAAAPGITYRSFPYHATGLPAEKQGFIGRERRSRPSPGP